MKNEKKKKKKKTLFHFMEKISESYSSVATSNNVWRVMIGNYYYVTN